VPKSAKSTSKNNYLDASFLLQAWKKPHHLQLPLTAVEEDIVIVYVII
jgi:hypothetical protein